uniref:Uncharacterized protein n=1 Tax=Aegilops tauschii subsp. strangulata TaxID=200361 RepID=A0A453AI54_AEGTS
FKFVLLRVRKQFNMCRCCLTFRVLSSLCSSLLKRAMPGLTTF